MPHNICLRPSFVLQCLLLLGWYAGLAGCGSGAYTSPATSVPVPLPADATYNTSVRAAGYTITDLGPGKVAAINMSGQVLGSNRHTYLWTNGSRHYLGILAGDKGGSDAISLNDNGQALGMSYGNPPAVEVGPGPSHIFVWQNGAFTRVADDSGNGHYAAYKINNAGQALISFSDYPATAVSELWQGGTTTPISIIGKSGKALALDSINNRGDIIGGGSDSPEVFQETPVPARSYLIQNGQATDLGFLTDRPRTGAQFINDNQQIVGIGFPYSVNDPDLPPLPFVWQNGQLTVLKGLLGDYVMNGLNKPGQIVGWIQDTSTARRFAFRYDLNTQMLVDLDATIGKSAGWQLTSATAINDVGQIIGEGQHNGQARSYLLTPQ